MATRKWLSIVKDEDWENIREGQFMEMLGTVADQYVKTGEEALFHCRL